MNRIQQRATLSPFDMRILLLTPLLLLGCAATEDVTVHHSASSDVACYACELRHSKTERDEATREHLFATLERLEGAWEMEDAEGGHEYIVFDVTAAGSVVREIMFPGQQHEMMNTYSLDGNTLMMTHYCGGGNQPRMRARELDDGSLAFEAFAVTDLPAAEATWMDSMTLVFIDDDTIEERWTARTAGVSGEMANFLLKRVEGDDSFIYELF